MPRSPGPPLTWRTGSKRDADEARILLGQTQNPQRNAGRRGLGLPQLGDRRGSRQQRRSEEHTSELQSLMRISYAVFCLQKKTRSNNNQSEHRHDANMYE